MSSLTKTAQVLFLLAAFSFGVRADQAEERRLAKFKAVFIYNFIEYVKWPAAKESGPFVIAVLGKSDITPFLQQIAPKRKVGGRKIEVRVQEALESDPPSCHILFVTSAYEKELEAIKGKLQGGYVLTVSDTKGFVQKGAHINFVLVDGKLKFEINPKTLDEAGLYMSSQLLKLALRVE